MRSSQEELEVHRTFIKVFLEDLLCVRYYSRHWWCNDVYESLCCDNIQVTTYLQYTWHLHIEFGKKSRLQNGVSLANNSLIDVWISIQGEGLSQETRRMRNSLSYCVPFFLWSGNQGINSSCSQNIWKGEIRREEYFFGQEGPQGHNEAHWQELISEDSTESSARQSQRGGGVQVGQARVEVEEIHSWGRGTEAGPFWSLSHSIGNQEQTERKRLTPNGVPFLPKARLQVETAWLEWKTGSQAFAHGLSEQ